ARSDLDERAIAPTVATISIVSSLTLAGLVAWFAEPIAVALGSAEATEPIRVMALCVAMIGPFAVPGAQLQREFRQDLVFRANIIAFVPSAATLIVISLLGEGALGFAWSRVVGQLVIGTLMFLSVSTRYRPGLDVRLVGGLLRFGLPLALANLLSQVLLNVDYVFVGRMLGVADVGLYNLAFNICMWSTATVASVLNGIVLPAFSHVRATGGSLPDALARAVRTVAFIACPIGAVTLALASPLIVTVYGAKWEGAAPVLGVLSVYGVVSVITLLLANVIISTGRTGILFTVQVVALVCLLPALWTGVTLGGLVGVGVAHIAVILFATLPLYLVAIRRSLGTSPLIVARSMLWPLIAAALAGLAGWAASLPLPNAPLQLLVGGMAAGLVYLLLTVRILTDVMPAGFARLRGVRTVVGLAAMPSELLFARKKGNR
ncbi:oligosaccharide flippase family protein, partial [Conyzicola sp.]|uniref:oligosaccharide flippase family protein n=1 Tax=Conyzicola sp. TaxID=1969404 RepID=UPI003989EE3C